jgi:hypothetical protein
VLRVQGADERGLFARLFAAALWHVGDGVAAAMVSVAGFDEIALG